MAVITPTTDVYLLKVPLEINDVNQLTFSNATAQYNYFNSLPKLDVHDFTYQRKDGIIRFAGEYDELITYNYVMYRNDEFSNKWFYAFITNMEWKSPNCTEISIKTDVWQSWQFDLTFKPVLIDREHTNDDTVGHNTLPEGLELGDMVINGTTIDFESLNYSAMVVIEVSQVENTGDGGTLSITWEDGNTWSTTPILNGLYRGTTPLIVDYGGNSSPTLEQVRKIYEYAGLSDSIVNIYSLPRKLIETGGNIQGHYVTLGLSGGTTTYDVPHIIIPYSSTTVKSFTDFTFTKPTNLAGYVPVNKKLLTYPYCYFNISNNAGTSIPYRYEDFSTTDVGFTTEGAFCVGGSVKALPKSYKRLGSLGNAMDYSITAGKYPTASWKSDSYTNWLTQNAVNMETQWKSTIASAGVDVLGGAMAGGLSGAILGGIGAGREIIATAREQHLAKTRANFVPDQVNGNINAGDFVWSKLRSPFTYLPMCIKPEYSACIDEFFSQYGYKCNRVKRPNITGRRNWNYVKTVGCYIDGDVPQDDMQEIKNMFDRGITFWHNPATFADYSQNNDII